MPRYHWFTGLVNLSQDIIDVLTWWIYKDSIGLLTDLAKNQDVIGLLIFLTETYNIY